MAAPLKERPKVLIPLPPLPEFYRTTTEGETMAPSSSSHAKHTTKSQKIGRKVVAVEVGLRTSADSRSAVEPVLPPAKPLSLEAEVDARPAVFCGRSQPPPVKLPPFPPPPPPGLEFRNHDKMTHRYSYYQHHTSKHHDTKPPERSQSQGARVINIPPPPPGFPGGLAVLVETEPIRQPTLTVYHICRICLRPRSEKYHLEHPISSDGMLPPPGICKRCRITSVEEKNDHTKVVHVEESDKVRVGISAFLPKHSLYTRQEASEAIRKQHRKGYGDIYVREGSSEEEEPERVVYRYVKRTTKSAPDPPPMERPEVSVENLAAMNLMNNQASPPPETGRTMMKVNVGSDYADFPNTGTVRHPAQNVRVAEIRRVERVETSDALASTKSSRSSTSAANDQMTSTAKASVSVRSSVASSKSKLTATAQAAAPAKTTAPIYTESEIRTFARDEVERYRQAERMMDAHPNAYAHGRMVPVAPAVPVERRIEVIKDTTATRPWEVPASPPREAAFAALRSRNASTASKDGTGSMERVSSEDSRHWYRPAESSPSASKSASSTRSPSTVRQKSTAQADGLDNARSYGYDTVITYQHERRTQSPTREAQQEPSATVQLKEIVGMIREEPVHSKLPSVSSSRKPEPNVIEVTEEIELPSGTHLRATPIRAPDPAISQRVDILRTAHDSDRQQRTRSPQEDRGMRSSRVSSFRTDKSYWEDEAIVRSASGLSSVRQDMHAENEVRASDQQHRAKTEVAVEETKEVFLMPSPTQFHPNLSSHGRSDDDSWYASRVKSLKKHQQMPEQPSSTPNPRDNTSDKTIWPLDNTPIRAPASSRMSMVEDDEDDDDWDWEYRKRIVTASDRPSGRRDDESAPGRHYVDTERIFRRRVPSQPSAHEQEMSTHSSHIQAKSPPREPPPREPSPIERRPRGPPIPEIVVSTEVEQESTHDRGRGPYMRSSEESAHVRFASKVEFSPTPPRSDESLPEQVRHSKPSSQISKGSAKKSSLRHQIDGGASEPPESAESILAEYETTRAIRGHSVERKEELDYVSVKHTSSARASAHSGSAAQHSFRSEPRSFRRQGSRRSTRTREDGGAAQDPPLDEVEQRSGRSGHSGLSRRSTRHSSPDNAETAAELSHNRRLARALSESPSRERLQQHYVRVQQQQEQKSETVISRGRRQDWDELQVDDKGPYREERRTESMDALYGSGHGGPKNKQREYVVREKW
ncbi:hypothetical protein MBLNU13_g00223t1 [Cladosporium sp. NU13]